MYFIKKKSDSGHTVEISPIRLFFTRTAKLSRVKMKFQQQICELAISLASIGKEILSD